MEAQRNFARFGQRERMSRNKDFQTIIGKYDWGWGPLST